MRVLLTGGAGFIGSHIADRLLLDGHEVTVADNLSTGRPAQVSPGLTLAQVSVLDPQLSDLCGGMDAVIHAAAQVSVAAAWTDPVGDALTNIVGTIRTLRAAIAGGVKRFLYLSSAAVYASADGAAIDEEHPLAPASPYGVSKLTGEHYVRLLCEAEGVDWLILRLANVYGPRQRAEGEAGVIARWVAALAAGRPITMQGDGLQTRDFVYVGDVANAVAQGLKSEPAVGEIVNIGTGCRTALLEVLTNLEAAVGAQAAIIWAPPRPGDIRHSTLAAGKAQRLLGWAPATSLRDGLQETVTWARQRRD